MVELIERSTVSQTNGSTTTIVKELGRGGQGIACQVEVGGHQSS